MDKLIPFEQQIWFRPAYLVPVPTAWDGCETILYDIINRFKVNRHCALEFGVDYGYSTSALANFFNLVIGVDTFEGDVHAGQRDKDLFEKTQDVLSDYKNIQLVRSDYRDWIKQDQPYKRYDLIHVDIVHSYKETNECVHWSVQNSDVVLVHDTISFPDVRRAVQDVCFETGRTFYEWQVKHGLGILVKE